MNTRKLAASLTAVVCSIGMLSDLPSFLAPVSAMELVHNDFETNYDGWYANADAVSMTAIAGIGHKDSRGMEVSGRTCASDGVSSEKGLYLSGGETHTYRIWVYSETAEQFHVTLACADLDTSQETETELVTKQVAAGTWTELQASYRAPKNSGEFRLTITTDSTHDFYFDDVTVSAKKSSNLVFAASTEKGLKDEFANYFRVGNILNAGTVKNSTITASFLKDYNSVECENETKPDATLVQSQCSGTNIGVSLKNAASIMDFCVNNHLAMRGHTLVWHSQTPVWFFKENFDANGNWVSSAVMDQRMETYIKNLFQAIQTQYPELNLYAYDVANECISDDQNRTANYGGTREPGENISGQSPWVQIYGSNAFVEKAFTYARKYAPEGCQLYYNDYNEYWDHKRDAIYSMCKSLYEKGLLDGIGMQSHINANYDGFSGVSAYTTAMKKFLSIGCDVQITELDITMENGKYTLQQQADKYKAIFQAAMDWNKNPTSDGRVTAVCIWGPDDANTWIKTENTPLLYDTNHQPKLAYTTLTSMIPQSEWGDGSNPGTTEQPVEPNEYGWYFHNTFEGDLDGWSSRGDAEVSTSGRTAYVGKEALLVQNRTAAWNGAARNLNPKAFVAGKTYSFSTNVQYFDGDATDTFYFKLQYTDANGDTQYDTIAEGTAIQGEWMQLANKNYKIPEGATNLQIYVETKDSTNNFYLDEVIGAVGGTSIIGAGEAPTLTLGDVNADGVINVLDLSLAKHGVSSGFSGNAAKLAADVNQDGIADAADVKMLQDYLLGRISVFSKAETSGKVDTSAYMKAVSENLSEYAASGITEEQAGVTYGTLKKYQYYSTTRERNTNVNVLLPPGYDETKTYPVLYALHGYWETEDSLAAMGAVKNMLGNLISKGEAEKMIVVFPYIYTSKTKEACDGLNLENSLNYDNFINDLTTDLMPYIEKNFSVKTGRENTAITGFSMGGRESLFIGLTRSDLFGYVGASCPAPGLTPGTDLSMHPGQLQENQLKPAYNMPNLILITGGGKDGTVGTQPSTYHNILTTNGVEHVWHAVTNGGHDASSVQPHFYNYLRSIFQEKYMVKKNNSNVNAAAMEALFAGITPTASYKADDENNSLFTQRFGADPGVMEYNGRVYVYTTNDVIEYDSNGKVTENTYAQVNKINCLSSEDLVNWTDHGAIPVAGTDGIAKWATCSWAPCAAHKTINGKEKFFLYFCNGGNGVSVLTADSPTGPWTDPLGKALITRATPNCNDITWLFDPAVMVDDDGTGYLCFGGGVPDGKDAMPGTSRIVKLGDDMISLAGTPVTIEAPYLFEDSGINKIGDTYYYTYCSNWKTAGNAYGMTSGAIEYMTSNNPLGPYTYGGELFRNQGTFFGLYGNNHHSLCTLDGQLYLFYHNRSVEKAMGIEGNYRSPQVDAVTMQGTKIQAVTGTMTGIAQKKTINPYQTVQAETMSNQAGIQVRGLGDTVVTEIDQGDWLKVSGVHFSKGASQIAIQASSKNGCAVKICTGSPTGKAVGYAEIPAGGKMTTVSAAVQGLNGTQDLYFVFSGQAEMDSWSAK